ncbi:MAG: ester cyclase [Cyanobacteria bacterium]|nr:ester cyclase [Cyanobacteriota bacterium]MDW8199607.1 ester cyclase [Cyanobacteriota bacterium SKYGB_h_bin112]
MTDQESNKDLIKRWITNGNRGFSDSFEDYIASNFIGHSRRGLIGFHELQRLELAFVDAFPDANYAIEDLIAENDRVVLRVTTRGTHRKMFHGVAPTNRYVEFSGIVIYRIRDNKIVECWDEIDVASLWQQITE